MFSRLTFNIGESIKTLAKIIYYFNIVLAALSLIGAFFGGLIGCFAEGPFLGFIIFASSLGGAIVFVVQAIVSTMIIYGFGELISTNKMTYELMKQNGGDNGQTTEPSPYVPSSSAPQPQQQTQAAPAVDIKGIIANREVKEGKLKCPDCGNIQSENIKRCLKCGILIEE